jgi:hypothetical protein
MLYNPRVLQYQRFEDLVPDGGRGQNLALFLTHSQSQLECLCLWLLGTRPGRCSPYSVLIKLSFEGALTKKFVLLIPFFIIK